LGKDSKTAPHLRIANEILRSKAFGQFSRTNEASVWFYLNGWIIRGEMNTCGLAHKLYKEFYLGQKKLVARWDQEKIAEHLGYSQKSKGYISTLVRKLEKEWKIIKTVKVPSYNSHKLNVYELGYIDDDGTEHLYFTERFLKSAFEEKWHPLDEQNED